MCTAAAGSSTPAITTPPATAIGESAVPIDPVREKSVVVTAIGEGVLVVMPVPPTAFSMLSPAAMSTVPSGAATEPIRSVPVGWAIATPAGPLVSSRVPAATTIGRSTRNRKPSVIRTASPRRPARPSSSSWAAVSVPARSSLARIVTGSPILPTVLVRETSATLVPVMFTVPPTRTAGSQGRVASARSRPERASRARASRPRWAITCCRWASVSAKVQSAS